MSWFPVGAVLGYLGSKLFGDKDNSKLNSLENALNENNRKFEEIKKENEQQIRQHREANERLERQQREELDRLQEEFEKAKAEHDEKSEQLKQEYNIKCDEFQQNIEEHKSAIKQMEEKHEIQQKLHEEKLRNITENYKVEIEKINEQRERDSESYDQKLKDQEEKNRQEISTMKTVALQDKVSQLKKMEISLSKPLKEATQALKKQTKRVEALNKQYEDEKKRVTYFKFEREKNVKNVVLLGITGEGKSTFGNRCLGDESPRGDQGKFGVSHQADSETVLPNKYRVPDHNISIIDTPGTFDSKNRDRYHLNTLIEYLRGCGGVNCFAIVQSHSGNVRFNQSYQKMCKILEKHLGQNFWEHVVIILTKVQTDNLADYKKWKESFLNLLREEFNLSSDIKLPMLPIDSGGKKKHWKSQIVKFFNKFIPNKKFNCDALESPINDLEKFLHIQRKQLSAIKLEYHRRKKNIASIRQQLKETIDILRKKGEMVDRAYYPSKDPENYDDEEDGDDDNEDDDDDGDYFYDDDDEYDANKVWDNSKSKEKQTKEVISNQENNNSEDEKDDHDYIPCPNYREIKNITSNFSKCISKKRNFADESQLEGDYGIKKFNLADF